MPNRSPLLKMSVLGGPQLGSLSTLVELRVSCRNLIDRDVMSKSDPMAVLYTFNEKLGAKDLWLEKDRTERISNNHDPTFVKAFTIDYCFETVQKLCIRIYDIDNKTEKMSDDDFLGQMECTLAQIVAGSPFTQPLVSKHGKLKSKKGSITVTATEISRNNDIAQLRFYAKKLDKKDTFSKSDPYLELSRTDSAGQKIIIYRTEVKQNTLNPEWRHFEVSVQSLCNGDLDMAIQVESYDHDDDSTPDLIGITEVKVSEMLSGANTQGQCEGVSWPLIHPKKQGKKKYTNSGVLFVSTCKIVKSYSFLDFIFGGLQINFTVAIDFTGSNGNPKDPSSLHFMNPVEPNEYLQAIRAVGNVCQDYDSDKFFPALGFGAGIPPDFRTSHEFALNFNPSNPFCVGIDGVIDAYMRCLPQVKLSGPTNAAPVINHVIRFAEGAQSEEINKGAAMYYVLLILTDGELTDLTETVQAVIKASYLPMSLIIVGVGGAGFHAMNMLDADNGRLKSKNGDVAKRDIVQFVPFRDYKNAGPEELARHVLAEVPKQLTEYYRMRALGPRQPTPAPAPAANLSQPGYPAPPPGQDGYPPIQPAAAPYPGPQMADGYHGQQPPVSYPAQAHM